MAHPRIVILSAGASRRLGQPKALAKLPGGRPLFRLMRVATQAAGTPPLVVTGAHHSEIVQALQETTPPKAPTLSFNRDWAVGRTGSLICAAESLAPCDLCVLPVDHPRISRKLLEDLFREWRRREAPASGWLAPATGMPLKPGHPIVIGAELVATLLSDKDHWKERPLSQLRSQAAPLWMLPTDDATIHENLDRPEDLERLTRLDEEP